MSLPFSFDPTDYDVVKAVFVNNSITPVILVLGGSYGQKTMHVDSDLDLFGVYEEEEPEEISIHPDERTSLLGDYQDIQIILHSLKVVKEAIADPYVLNDPPRRMWFYEEFMSFPRIIDTPAADAYRTVLDQYDNATVAEWYLESGDWYLTNLARREKRDTRVTRLFLTAARLLEIGDHIIDYQALLSWSDVSTVEDARARLVNAL